MSHSIESATQIKKWTKEEVHQWLTTQVNIHHIYADKLLEEEVSGEYLEYFQKKDLLDLNIKHGPAVKIVSMLEDLKSGLQHKSQFPAYIKKWTPEQVCQWLREEAKLYHQYVGRILEEEVSGDCLFCFKKNDLVELGIKHGPAVKIIGMLEQLNNGPEPILQPPTHINSDQENLQKPPENQEELCQTLPVQTVSPMKTEPNTEEPRIVEPPGKTVTRKKEPKPQAMGAEMLPSKMTSSLTLLQNTLDDLQQDEFKRFKSCLKDFKLNGCRSIARCHLEDNKSRTDVADSMTKHYEEETLNVTLQILERIRHNELAGQLKSAMGLQMMKAQDGKNNLRRETNQGDKLKNLLTYGGNMMDYYDRFVIVMNKSRTEQLEYLPFLSKLKLFCVLDFDPDSAAPGGVCSSYRESRVANLHLPAQFQGEPNVVIKNLNLYNQTSWVFCNGRHDLESKSVRQLDYKVWFKEKRKEIEHMVSFICKPEVLPNGRTLVIFLLLSPVSDRDPVFDTFLAFYSHAEESIVSICESRSTFEKWKDLIQEKCESDISTQSIYELTLSEVNGTIMSLGPHNQPSGRLLPSSDSSTVVLQQKDEDRLTALDILCQNECEKVYEENSTEFKAFKIKVEKEFYRGGKVNWWNFYFCEKRKAKPFIRRDKYDNLMKIVKCQTKDPKTTCVLLNLFHHPGCGGTTLAMHVMWDLRREFRCAVLKDNTLPKAEVAVQVKKLMRLGKSDKSQNTPVLLLVDDSKEAENTQTLQNCIRKTVEEDYTGRTVEDSSNSQVIILSCVRSHNPKVQYKHCATESQYITAILTKKEQDDFEEKLKELKESHEKPENFYSFMIMKSNFDKKYIADVVSHTLKDLDTSTKKAQLLFYFALLNSYVAESDISVSLCEDFFGMKMAYWGEDNVLERMESYSNLLKIVKVDDRGGYKAISILHRDIASACLEELHKSHGINESQITINMLHCDLFFKIGVVKDTLMLSIERLLIKRQRRKDGDEKDTQFSPLIEKIHLQEGRHKIQDIFVKASSRFFTSASIPQALARYLYLNQQDFPQALNWAENAKRITENPYTVDTIGQVYKSYLKHNIQNEKKKTPRNPGDLDTNLKLAKNAIKAFQRAQELAMNEDQPDEEADDNLSKSSYNIFGYVGEIETVLTVFEILSKLPFFEEADPVTQKYMQSFLNGKMPINSVPKNDNEINRKYVDIIQEHKSFLLNLKSQVKKVFEFLNDYYTYMKGNDAGDFETRNRTKISGHFKTYITLFCSSPEEISKEQTSKPKLRLNMDIEKCRKLLEEKNADTFAGVLHHLDKTAEEMEEIIECYKFLRQNCERITKEKDKNNFILANIILSILKPNSRNVKSHKELTDLLMLTLQDIGVQHPFPEPYYLALLLLWPSSNAEDADIRIYVNSLRNSFRRKLSKFMRMRNTIAHFYLGQRNGLERLVPKAKLDECFAHVARKARTNLAQLWRSGDIFKDKKIIDRLCRVNGTMEEGELYANYGQLKIPVRPAYLGGISSGFSTEKVSFFVGFAIDGPLAYDIKYE
uniref:sterile alpha motif domain-containing protein 9-like n=1 Tax=Oncorhynchus gorbuscha TaxID=8017 RepID=UPI001EAEFD67|nr:sterile alpha motif domain-containing protein 9-like [Oncorhynchus gorbuscha]